MTNITRVYGRIAERRADINARIEVLAYRSPNGIHQQPTELKQNFPPWGYVFAPSIFDRMDDVQIGSLIEFNTVPSQNSNGDVNLLDFSREPKLTSLRVIEVQQEIFSAENALNQPALKEFISEELAHFYISQTTWLYGPFKNQGKDVVPKSGMSVKKYQLPEVYIAGGKRFLLFEPQHGAVGDIDCMTPAQLGNFLKELLKATKIATEIGPLKKALEALPQDTLGVARVQRIAAGLDKLTLASSELSELAGLSVGLKTMYGHALQTARDELKSEFLDEITGEKAIIEKELSQTKQGLQKIKKEKEKYEKELLLLKREHSHLSKDKDRLIMDIRMGSLVGGQNGGRQSGLITREEQLYLSDGPAFEDLTGFIQFLSGSWEPGLRSERTPSLYFLYLFKDYRCLLVKNLAAVLSVMRLTNNCRLVIQQVEADWLKFEHLYNNSLQYIWEKAHEEPAVIHFLVLEDINLAGIECYAKPLLDILDGVRLKLPGCDTSWPENLWIIGSSLPADGERAIGLPLSQMTFSQWGYIPFESPIHLVAPPGSLLQLIAASLTSHDKIAPQTTNPHLSE